MKPLDWQELWAKINLFPLCNRLHLIFCYNDEHQTNKAYGWCEHLWQARGFRRKWQVGRCLLSTACTSLSLALQSRAVVVQTHHDNSMSAMSNSGLHHQHDSFFLSDSCSSRISSVNISCSFLVILHRIPPHALKEPSSSSLLTSEFLSFFRIPSFILTYLPTHVWLVESNARLSSTY